MDALFRRLKRNGIDCHASPVSAGALKCADDVALVSHLFMHDLRCMVVLCEKLVKECQINFNLTTCK